MPDIDQRGQKVDTQINVARTGKVIEIINVNVYNYFTDKPTPSLPIGITSVKELQQYIREQIKLRAHIQKDLDALEQRLEQHQQIMLSDLLKLNDLYRKLSIDIFELAGWEALLKYKSDIGQGILSDLNRLINRLERRRKRLVNTWLSSLVEEERVLRRHRQVLVSNNPGKEERLEKRLNGLGNSHKVIESAKNARFPSTTKVPSVVQPTAITTKPLPQSRRSKPLSIGDTAVGSAFLIVIANTLIYFIWGTVLSFSSSLIAFLFLFVLSFRSGEFSKDQKSNKNTNSNR